MVLIQKQVVMLCWISCTLCNTKLRQTFWTQNKPSTNADQTLHSKIFCNHPIEQYNSLQKGHCFWATLPILQCMQALADNGEKTGRILAMTYDVCINSCCNRCSNQSPKCIRSKSSDTASPTAPYTAKVTHTQSKDKGNTSEKIDWSRGVKDSPQLSAILVPTYFTE